MKQLTYRLVLAVSIGLIMISCNTETKFTDAGKKSVVDSVTKTLQQYQHDISTSGLMSEFKYLDQSKDFFWVPPGFNDAMPYDSIAKAIKQNAKHMKNKHLITTFEKLQVIALTKEYATYTARLKSVVTDSVGDAVEIRLLETGLMVKRKDGWKLQSGQTSVMD